MAASKTIGYGRIFWILSISVFLFCLLGRLINVYRFAFVGAVFELLWLPAILLLLVLPILVFIYWMKERCSLRSIHLYSLLVLAATILLLLFLN
ncbi:MAG TPA: hypothetical protein PKC54_14635 [Ferruginibacter sp.]|nr:hypothetical protein [Ferruginibacter sp.]